MTIESRRAAMLTLINLPGTRLRGHQIRTDARQKRASVFDLHPFRMLEQSARKASQFVLELFGRREVMIDLDQHQAQNGCGIVDVHGSIGQIVVVPELNHDGSLRIALMKIDGRGCLSRINLSNPKVLG